MNERRIGGDARVSRGRVVASLGASAIAAGLAGRITEWSTVTSADGAAGFWAAGIAWSFSTQAQPDPHSPRSGADRRLAPHWPSWAPAGESQQQLHRLVEQVRPSHSHDAGTAGVRSEERITASRAAIRMLRQ
jgi:hypothetical protein